MKNKIIVALDTDSIKELERLLDVLSPHVEIFKVGMELFYSCGPKAIDIIKKHDRDIFLDLKLCDIPNTVYKSARVITRLGVRIFNVHASGGKDMMSRALEGAAEESERLGITRPMIAGVTVLTSMDADALKETGVKKAPCEQVLDLAKLAKKSGLDGVIASPQEITDIKEALGKDFLIITPGVRPAGSDTDDQKRTAAPKETIERGADYIVIGRPVTKAKDPAKALKGLL